MHSEFEDLNAYVYHTARGAVFDGLIWCLGPYVYESREYGWSRIYLARLTRSLVRRWFRITD